MLSPNYSTLLVVLLCISIPSNKAKKHPTENEYQMQHTDFTLMSNYIPFIVNPDETMEPPTFAVTVHKMVNIVGSGAIISKYYVLTLCVLLKSRSESLAKASHFGVRYHLSVQGNAFIAAASAKKLYTHPKCVRNGRGIPESNVGLIETKESMDQIKYPKLPTIHIPDDDTTYIISNFREANHAATDSRSAIWYVITKKVESDLCEALFVADDEVFSREGNLCMAYYHVGGAHSCTMDMGQPLSIRHNGTDTLVGLNLHKHQCGHPREAASFVCVKTNKDWINGIIR